MMKFNLSFNNFAEQIQLPVNPKEFRISTGMKNTVVDVQNLGELNLIGGEKLAEIELSSFFPAEPLSAPYISTQNLLKPYEYVEQIVKWRKSRKPIRLIITDSPINLACAIESFEYGERGGSRDVEYTLVLKEYRFVKIEQITVPQPQITTPSEKPALKSRKKPSAKGKKGARPDPRPSPRTEYWRTGDNLLLISRRVYGTDSRWPDLYRANARLLWPNYSPVPPRPEISVRLAGTKLVIP
jgi:hypothetical protein